VPWRRGMVDDRMTVVSLLAETFIDPVSAAR
jgi:hypothetical protein